MNQEKKQFNWIDYILAWFTYGGALFTQIGKLGDIIRSAFLDIKPPKKSEYERS